MDIVEFLTARENERETAARAAISGNPAPWYAVNGVVTGGVVRHVNAWLDGDLWDSEGAADRLSMRPDTAAFVARHDPAWVLADVAAKRAVVALHDDQHECPPDLRSADWPPQPCLTLLLLAQSYAGHPEFDPAWRQELDSQQQSVDFRRSALAGIRERDHARPAPTSRADSVCMCCYDGLDRVYRCRGCEAGFGPDRDRLEPRYPTLTDARDGVGHGDLPVAPS